MTLRRRARGYVHKGGFVMLVWRGGAWTWWWERQPAHQNGSDDG